MHKTIWKRGEETSRIFHGPVEARSHQRSRKRYQTQDQHPKIKSLQPAPDAIQIWQRLLEQPAQRYRDERCEGHKQEQIPEKPQVLEMEIGGGQLAFLAADHG